MDPNNPNQQQDQQYTQTPQQGYQPTPQGQQLYPNQPEIYQQPAPAKPVRGDRKLTIAIVVGVVSLLLIGVLSMVGGGERQSNTDDRQSVTSSGADEKRQLDISRLVTTLEEYASFNSGVYPTFETLQQNIAPQTLGDDFTDPSTETAYAIIKTVPTQVGEIQYSLNSYCGSGDGATVPAEGTRLYAVQTLLENGEYFCQDNR